ncbi:MAG: VOC family protein [Steroidobacter sp.]
MSASSPHGHFVWHDLITTDISAGLEFYKKITGWKTQPFDPEGRYLMWVNNSGAVGGIGAAPQGTKPYWRIYIGTDDIEATVFKAQQLGGTVVAPVTDIPGVGRWAALRDPQGNEFGVFWAPDTKAPVLSMQPGEFHWHELATDDYKAAFEFYRTLFGWQHGIEHNMGDLGAYLVFKNEGRPNGLGGFYNKQPGTANGGGWCTYTIVKDVKKAAASIDKLGGKNTHKPVKVPGGSWVIKFTDPQGAAHALTSSDESDVQARKPTAAAKPGTKASATKSTKRVAGKPARKSAKKKAAKKPVKSKTAAKRKKSSAKKVVKRKALKKAAGKKAKQRAKARKKK